MTAVSANVVATNPAVGVGGGSMPNVPYAPSTMADIWLMFTTMFTSAMGTTISHASHAPISERTMSIIPRPPDRIPTRDAESSVTITIGTIRSATHNRSNPNHAPASSRVATAPAPIIPAAVSDAGPTTLVNHSTNTFRRVAEATGDA